MTLGRGWCWVLTALLIGRTSAGEDDAGPDGFDKGIGVGAETCKVRGVAVDLLSSGVQAAQGTLGDLANHAGEIVGRGSCSCSSRGSALSGGRGDQISRSDEDDRDSHTGRLSFRGGDGRVVRLLD